MTSGRGGGDLFEVVEDEERLAVAQPLAEGIGDRSTLRLR